MSRGACVALTLLVCACQGPKPQEVLVDLRTPVGTVYGLSTETGILVLTEAIPDPTEAPTNPADDDDTLNPQKANAAKGEYAFRYHVGNGMFDDVARLLTRGEQVSILQAASSRPNEARIGTSPAREDDYLYVEVRNQEGESILVSARLYQKGAQGDLLLPSAGGLIEQLAQEYAGAGLFAYRDSHLQLVGILNGVYSPESPSALAFIGIDEVARMLPQAFSYVERETYPNRMDFEYGIPRDFAGEKMNSSGAGEVPPYQPENLLLEGLAPAETGAVEPADPGLPDGLPRSP